MSRWTDDAFIAFDFETSGTLPEYALQPWRMETGKFWPTSLVHMRKDGDQMVTGGGLWPDVADAEAMLDDAIENGRALVGWNVVFDIAVLMALGLREKCLKASWLDGMLLWRHLFIEPEYDVSAAHKRKSYSLKSAVAEELPQFAGYEEDIDFHSTDPESLRKLHAYNVRDVAFTLRLAKRYFTRLEKYPRRLKAALIEAQCIPLVAEANFHGMPVDELACRELEQVLTNTADEMLEALSPYGVSEKVIRSPQQLAALLFDQWGLPVLKENTGKKTGKVSRSTDKEVLHELAFMDDRVQQLRDYREALNNRTKFATAPLTSAHYNEDSRTRPEAKIFGTYSGRFTYASKQGRNKAARQTGFALHQEKSGKEYRDIIIAPEGYSIVEFDAAGQEFRWMAIASGDPTMLSLCVPGEDAHSYMGAQVYSDNYRALIERVRREEKEAKSRRQMGKVGNLSLQYRTSAKKLRVVARTQYNIPMELPEAQLIHRTYRQSYPGVPAYWERQIQFTKHKGYAETLAGRRVQVQGDWSKQGWQMGSTAINYTIQGTGADQKYLAMMVLKDWFTSEGVRFAWDLHDGIYWFIPDARVNDIVPRALKKLNNLPYKQAWGFQPEIPLPWEAKVGKSWGSLREMHCD